MTITSISVYQDGFVDKINVIYTSKRIGKNQLFNRLIKMNIEKTQMYRKKLIFLYIF